MRVNRVVLVERYLRSYTEVVKACSDPRVERDVNHLYWRFRNYVMRQFFWTRFPLAWLRPMEQWELSAIEDAAHAWLISNIHLHSTLCAMGQLHHDVTPMGFRGISTDTVVWLAIARRIAELQDS